MTPKAYPTKIEIYDHDEHGRTPCGFGRELAQIAQMEAGR